MKFMTTKEIADILSVNKITVRRLIKSGQLRAIKINRSIRVTENSFQEYIRHGLGIADNEIEDNFCDDMEKVSTAIQHDLILVSADSDLLNLNSIHGLKVENW